MKRSIMLAIAVVLSAFAQCSIAVDARQLEESRRYMAQQEKRSPNDSAVAQGNSHVYRNGYTPTDLVQVSHEGFNCTEQGYQTRENTQGNFCRDMKSRSNGSTWRMRHAFKYPGSPIEYVFKLTNGQPTLWVKYNPGNQRVEYASAGAQQYAASHGGGQYAKGNQPAQGQQQQAANGGQCDHLSGKMRAGCEAAAGAGIIPNIGGLLKW